MHRTASQQKILTKNTHKHLKAQHCTQLVRLWGNRHSCLQLVEMPYGTSTVMGNWQHLTKLCMGLSLHPVILLLGIYPEDIPPMVWKHTLTRFFTVALFVFAKFWNWFKCPNIEDWLNKVHTQNGTMQKRMRMASLINLYEMISRIYW